MSKTNYMGIRRLKAIFLHFLSNDEELFREYKKDRREHGDSWIFCYKRSNGAEWLNVDFGSDYLFKFFAYGSHGKSVSLTIYQYNESICDYEEIEHFVTYYDSNFAPLPKVMWSGSKHRYLTDFDFGRFDYPYENFVCDSIVKSLASSEGGD